MNASLEGEGFEHAQVQAKSTRASSPFTDSYNSLASSQLDEFEVDIHTPEMKERTPTEKFEDRSASHDEKEIAMTSNCLPSGHMMSPIVSAILDELAETASSILAEDDAGLALLDSQIESCILKPELKNLPRLRLGCFNCPEAHSRSGYAVGADNSSKNFPSTVMQTHEQGPGGCIRDANGCMVKHDGVKGRNMVLAAAGTTQDFSASLEGRDEKFLQGCGLGEESVPKHHNAVAHLGLSPEEKSKPLITTNDFLPSATPKQLMRKLLYLNSSNTDSRRVSLDQEVVQCEDGVPDVVDMDVETSSEAGWSVRDNPIASDESFQAGISDEDEDEDRQKQPAEVIRQPQNFLSSDCNGSRDIHMLSPVYREARSTNCTEGGFHQEKTTDSTFQCISNFPSSTSTEAGYCRNFYEDWFTCNSDSQRIMSSETLASCSPVFKYSNVDSFGYISSELVDVQHDDKVERIGPYSNFLAVGEGTTAVESHGRECYRLESSGRNPRSIFDSLDLGQYVIPRASLAKTWRKFCWYGEIVLGGTLCLVVTLPLAMALAKTVTSPSNYLVPT